MTKLEELMKELLKETTKMGLVLRKAQQYYQRNTNLVTYASVSEKETAEHVMNILRSLDQNFYGSEVYKQYLEQENKRREKNAAARGNLRRERHKQTKEWIKDGTIKPGVFIKVSGTRDGVGIREVIDVRPGDNTITCRKWSRVSSWQRSPTSTYPKISVKEMVDNKYRVVEGMLLEPQADMTTHELNKVVKILKEGNEK